MKVSQVSQRVLRKVTSKRDVSACFARQMLQRSSVRDVGLLTHRAMVKLSSIRDVAQLSERRLLRLSPNFRWIEMFLDLVFPHDISEGSDGAARFSTKVNQVASGFDYRMAQWDYPLMEYNVAYGVRTLEQLHALIRFFRVCKGRLNSFRFLDHLDYTSTFAERPESRAAPAIGAFDQEIAVGDGEELQFQLRKNYQFDGEVSYRPILKPIEGTVLVGVDGIAISHYEVDHSTGIVSLLNRAPQDMVTPTITKVAADQWKLTSPAPLPMFTPGERVSWAAVAGFSAVTNARVLARSDTEILLEHTRVTSTPQTAGADVSVVTNNAPLEGESVTAGYQFHVPVRFETDRLPVRLDYYGIGSASEIKLVEVRPEAW